MKLSRGTLVLAALAALAGGCRSDSASYMIDGPEHSLTLIVDQSYFWDGEWQIGLLTTRQPECMRRHPLKPAPIQGFKMDVFQTLEGGYTVKERSNWYIAETQKCQLQQFKTPPVEPGDLRGSFEFKDGKLSFAALPKPVAPAQPAGAAPAVSGAAAASAASAPQVPQPGAAAAGSPPALPAAAPAGR